MANVMSLQMGQASKSEWVCLPRKCIVKVILSNEQRRILDELARRLGTSESETLRLALMDYAKELSLVTEMMHKASGQAF